MKLLGIDEAGRGALCGPVTAACVLFPHNTQLDTHEIDDSKKLTPQKRTHIVKMIRKNTVWGIGWAYPHTIDTINIHHASLLAMELSLQHLLVQFSTHIAINALHAHNTLALIDGKYCPTLQINNELIQTKAIVKGDTKIKEIQAASILAKTARDFHMCLLGKAFPNYFLSKHKGYPTTLHKTLIRTHGTNGIYRKSFKWH